MHRTGPVRGAPLIASARMRCSGPLLVLVATLGAPSRPALAGGPPIMLNESGVDASLAKRVRAIAAGRRAIRDDLSLPPPESTSPEQITMRERADSIKLALGRARRAESEASWEACVRESASVLSDAIEVLARVDDLGLLRDLHRQMGVCLTLNDSAASARPHFVSAALLDETTPRSGVHREEAEEAEGGARAEVLARSHGPLRIESTPAGAEVWIDGHKAPGTTPLEVDVRLGDHFVTMRRFRFESHTELAVLQPSGVVRVVLDPARRSTLREQLSAYAGGREQAIGEEELRLARAVWSRAEQVLSMDRAAAGSLALKVVDAVSGEVVRSTVVARPAEDDALRRGVCEALGETCVASSRGVAWYVWPISGLALAGAVVSATFVVNAERSYRYCFGVCQR